MVGGKGGGGGGEGKGGGVGGGGGSAASTRSIEKKKASAKGLAHIDAKPSVGTMHSTIRVAHGLALATIPLLSRACRGERGKGWREDVNGYRDVCTLRVGSGREERGGALVRRTGGASLGFALNSAIDDIRNTQSKSLNKRLNL